VGRRLGTRLQRAGAGALVRSLLSRAQTPGWHPEEYGALLLTLDIGSFTDPGRFRTEVSALCAALRAETPAEGFGAVVIPGDRGHARAAEARAAGIIEVEERVAKQLEKLASSIP